MKNDHLNNQIFKEINTLFKNNNCSYWICHGTLLGIIRENRILPWDNDIDFAVWDNEVSKDEIINHFLERGYDFEPIFGEMDCLHFTKETKKVDVSFYKTNGNTASIKWVIPNTSFYSKGIVFISQVIGKNTYFYNFSLKNYNIKLIMKFILMVFTFPIQILLPKFILNKFQGYAKKHIKYGGYSYPLELMKFKHINFLDESVPVPIESEQCLALTYGTDWKTPKKDYIWYKEASNLINL